MTLDHQERIAFLKSRGQLDPKPIGKPSAALLKNKTSSLLKDVVERVVPMDKLPESFPLATSTSKQVSVDLEAVYKGEISVDQYVSEMTKEDRLSLESSLPDAIKQRFLSRTAHKTKVPTSNVITTTTPSLNGTASSSSILESDPILKQIRDALPSSVVTETQKLNWIESRNTCESKMYCDYQGNLVTEPNEDLIGIPSDLDKLCRSANASQRQLGVICASRLILNHCQKKHDLSEHFHLCMTLLVHVIKQNSSWNPTAQFWWQRALMELFQSDAPIMIPLEDDDVGYSPIFTEPVLFTPSGWAYLLASDTLLVRRLISNPSTVLLLGLITVLAKDAAAEFHWPPVHLNVEKDLYEKLKILPEAESLMRRLQSPEFEFHDNAKTVYVKLTQGMIVENSSFWIEKWSAEPTAIHTAIVSRLLRTVNCPNLPWSKVPLHWFPLVQNGDALFEYWFACRVADQRSTFLSKHLSFLTEEQQDSLMKALTVVCEDERRQCAWPLWQFVYSDSITLTAEQWQKIVLVLFDLIPAHFTCDLYIALLILLQRECLDVYQDAVLIESLLPKQFSIDESKRTHYCAVYEKALDHYDAMALGNSLYAKVLQWPMKHDWKELSVLFQKAIKEQRIFIQ